jgi:hypothetical protein
MVAGIPGGWRVATVPCFEGTVQKGGEEKEDRTTRGGVQRWAELGNIKTGPQGGRLKQDHLIREWAEASLFGAYRRCQEPGSSRDALQGRDGALVTPLSVGLLEVLLGFTLRTGKYFEVCSYRCDRPLFGWRRAIALGVDADRGLGLRSRRPRDSGTDEGCVELPQTHVRDVQNEWTTSCICGTEIFGD